MYSGSLSGTHKIRYRKILRGHHGVGVCFIQDMWGKAMHMHRAADLVTDEPIWLKEAPGYFSFVAAGHDQEAARGMLCG